MSSGISLRLIFVEISQDKMEGYVIIGKSGLIDFLDVVIYQEKMIE
jgi:hypothetical protein